jgi:hypothetical protein
MFLWFPVLDLARAPRRTARKKGSGYENALKLFSPEIQQELSSSPGPLGHARPPWALGTEPEVQENLQQFLKRMVLNLDAFASVAIFTVKYYEETKYLCWHILIKINNFAWQ